MSGAEGSDAVTGTHAAFIRKTQSSQQIVPTVVHSEPEYDANDSVEVLRERIEQQKMRYEKWKKDHMDDTRLKLSILSEDNRKMHEELRETQAELEKVKAAYENVKAHSARAQAIWEEERQKLVKRYAEDQKKIEKLQKQNKTKTAKASAPQSVMKSHIFGRGKPPEPTVPAPTLGNSISLGSGTGGITGGGSITQSMSLKNGNGGGGPVVGEPRLVSHSSTVPSTGERDSTPLPVPNSSASALNRIRKPEDFELCAVVGQGGFGAVFLCREPGPGLVCAVQRMAKSTIIAKEQVHTVNVEVNVLKEARMEENPWIVQFHYAFQDACYIYLAMEFCSGGDLRNLIDNVELDEDGCRFLAAEMIVSVNSLHERGYVHRDLKPSNFLISSTGHLKLPDFGLSKSGFSGVKKPTGDAAQAIRVFLADERAAVERDCAALTKSKAEESDKWQKQEVFLIGKIRENEQQLGELMRAAGN